MRCHLLALTPCAALVLLLAPAVAARAEWPLNGLLICNACSARSPKFIVSDGGGGAIVVWNDVRDDNDDIYAQRVTAVGTIAPGWLADGVPVCVDPESQAPYWDPAPDGFGGVIVVWVDFRNQSGPTGVDMYAQRILADGSVAPGWPENGVAVSRAPGFQDHPFVLEDGNGGAFIAWDDIPTRDIYLQRLTAEGAVAPGWPTDGLAICADPNRQVLPQMVADGEGGVLVAWIDERDAPYATYAVRVTAAGALAPGWTANGVRIAAGCGMSDLLSDGAGGAYLACKTPGYDYFLQRFTGTGATAPGWPAGGVPVCTAPDLRFDLQMTTDGAGGALLVWDDYRDFWDDEIFMHRVRPDGSLAPGWPVDGLRVTDNNLFDTGPHLVPDEMGGAYLAWDRYFEPDDRVVVQRVTGGAAIAPGWPLSGHLLPGDGGGGNSRIAADGLGGAIVVWEYAYGGLRAQRFAVDGPVPVAVSLVSAEATPERVLIRWHGEGLAGIAATVYRRTSTGEWERLGSPDLDGPDGLRYEDPTVTAGARYAYRLGYAEGEAEQFTAEAWVDVPLAFQLSLGGFRPNPAMGSPIVAFTLADDAPATLELHDVAGRRVLARELRGMGAGRHALRLDEGRSLAAGVYLVRLHQAGRTFLARGVVVR